MAQPTNPRGIALERKFGPDRAVASRAGRFPSKRTKIAKLALQSPIKPID